MNRTKLHIAYILENRGFVEIPGIGTFSRQHRAASIEGDRLVPPSDFISFEHNPECCGSVELQHSIMLAEQVDSEQAYAILSEGLSDIHRELNTDNASVIEGVGTLCRVAETLSFKHDTAAQAFCYPEIELKCIQQRPAAYKNDILNPTDAYYRETFMKSLRRTASAAAAIAIFVFIAFIVSQIPGRPTATTQASFSFDTTQAPVTTFATTEPSPSADASLILIFNTPADASSPVETVETAQAIQQSASDARYCLVVASLANKAEADKYMKYAAPGLRLLEKDGRYRVYILEAGTAEELLAEADAAEIYTTYPSAWVCRK